MDSLNRLAWPAEFTGETYRHPHPAITPAVLEGQHPIRAWEYSRALQALEQWRVHQVQYKFADIGGAGSSFYRILHAVSPSTPSMYGCHVDVVDPSLATPDGQRGIVHGLLEGATAVKYDLAEWAGYAQNAGTYDVVFCLSVIEHVPASARDAFLHQLGTLVRPGGLLVLTCDAGESSVDIYHFHWMRNWIASPSTLYLLLGTLALEGFTILGAPGDFAYHGPTVFDYTVASLALVKES